MQRSTIISQQKILILTGLAGYILSVLFNLGYTELDGEEPRRALVSIEMLETGNFLVPALYGWEYYNKPPLFNWILSGFMFIFQSAQEWVVRLPSLIVLLIWSIVHFRFTRKFLNENIAFLSAIFFLTSGELYFYGLQNGGELDIFYAFITYLQVACLFYFFHHKKWLALFAYSYLFCAIGFLTKAFPSMAFQGLSLLALVIFARSFRFILSWQHLAGVFLFLLITGSYFYSYSFYASTEVYLINLLNEAIKKTPIGNESVGFLKNLYLYPQRMFIALMPWSIMVLLLYKKKWPSFWQNPLLRFTILFLICNIWLYWFFGVVKLRYSYVFYPFICLLLAVIYNHYQSSLNWSKIFKIAALSLLLLLLTTLVIPFFFEVTWFVFICTCIIMGGFIAWYYRQQGNLVLHFALGIIVARLAYAAVYLPLINDSRTSTSYRAPMAAVNVYTQSDTLVFYGVPDTLQVEANLVFWKSAPRKILVPPEIFKQVPYYYYLQSGKPVVYRTTSPTEKYAFSYQPFLNDSSISPIYSFNDSRMQHDFLLFQSQ